MFTLSRKTRTLVIFALILRISTFCVHSQEFDSIPKSLDDQFILTSSVMKEDRTIWVHLPPGYYESTINYPVLYLLDGGKHFPYVAPLVDYLSNFEQPYISPMIVVGIPNVDRGRDFIPLPAGNKSFEAEKGAGLFLQFIQSELIPQIEKKYRTAPYRILEGHSLGGLFTLFANSQEPGLFQASIFISPALTGSETSQLVMSAFARSLKLGGGRNRSFFISLGDESTASVDLLSATLKANAPASLQWSYQQFNGENHFSVPYKSMYAGLRYLYDGWFMEVFLNHKKISSADIKKHFQAMSIKFGYSVIPSEDYINQAGYEQLRAGNLQEAISLFRENVSNHPDSWNAFDSLGEAYLKAGDKKQAKENYARSIQLNPRNIAGKEALDSIK